MSDTLRALDNLLAIGKSFGIQEKLQECLFSALGDYRNPKGLHLRTAEFIDLNITSIQSQPRALFCSSGFLSNRE